MMMDSQKVHQAGCTLSVRLRDGMGVGATPAAWGGFTPFLWQAQDGESRHGRDRTTGGGSRRWRDRLVKWLEEIFCEVVK
jgi:hypothetical protein